MVPDSGKVLHSTAPNENDGVLLQIMADPGNVGRHFDPVGQTNAGHFPESGVRLLGGDGVDSCAYPTSCGIALKSRRGGLLSFILSSMTYQLIDRRHTTSSFI